VSGVSVQVSVLAFFTHDISHPPAPAQRGIRLGEGPTPVGAKSGDPVFYEAGKHNHSNQKDDTKTEKSNEKCKLNNEGCPYFLSIFSRRRKFSINSGIPTASPFYKGGLRGIFLIQPGLIENLRGGFPMSNEQLVFHFFNVVNKRELDGFHDLLTESAEFYFPKTQPLFGKNQVIRFFNILFRRYPALEFQIQRKIIQGQTAAVHWTNRGMNKKKEPYENEGVTILEMEGGKIKFISDFFKDTGKF